MQRCLCLAQAEYGTEIQLQLGTAARAMFPAEVAAVVAHLLPSSGGAPSGLGIPELAWIVTEYPNLKWERTTRTFSYEINSVQPGQENSRERYSR